MAITIIQSASFTGTARASVSSYIPQWVETFTFTSAPAANDYLAFAFNATWGGVIANSITLGNTQTTTATSGPSGSSLLKIGTGLTVPNGTWIGGPSIKSGTVVNAYNSSTGVATLSLGLGANFSATANAYTLVNNTGTPIPLYLLDDGTTGGGSSTLPIYASYISSNPSSLNKLIFVWGDGAAHSGFNNQSIIATAMEIKGTAAPSTAANSVKSRYTTAGGIIDSTSAGYVGQWVGSYDAATWSGDGKTLTLGGYAFSANIVQPGTYVVAAISSVIPNYVPMFAYSTTTFASTFSGTGSDYALVLEGQVVEQSASSNGGAQQAGAFGLNNWASCPIMTSYPASQQPWIGVFQALNGQGGSFTQVAATGVNIPTSSTFVIPTTSTVTGALASGYAVLYTQSGGIAFNYTSRGSTGFSGCTLANSLSTSFAVNGYSFINYSPNISTSGITGLFPSGSATSSKFGGLTLGDSTPSGTSVSPITVVSGGYGGSIYMMMAGYATSGSYTPINLYGTINNSSGGSPNGGIWTLVPSNRNVPKISTTTAENLSNAIEAVKRNRFSLLIQTSIVNAIEAVQRNRFSLLIQTSSAIAIKTITKSRLAKAIQTSAVLTIRKTLRNRYSKVTQIEVPNVSRKTFIRRFSTAIFTQTNRLTKRPGLIVVKRSLIAQIGASRATRTVSRKRSAQSIQNPNVLINRTINRIRLAKALLVESLSINRRVNRGRKAIVTQPVQAVVTRKINRGRRGIVTVNYSISTSRRKTSFRRAIATMVAVGKNIAIRPFHISTIEQATETHTLVSVSETATNNVDTTGEFTNENDLPPSDYNEPSITTPNDFNEPSITTPVDFTEPDWPTGEDVVPT